MTLKQVILDTETTGLDPQSGHRVIEIGCVEMLDRKLTGNHYHVYINPKREVDAGAFKVHGISNEFLEDKPFFEQIADEFLMFIEDSELIIHNAPFDVGFLNSELKHVGRKLVLEDRCTILDTLQLAREKHPGQRNSLDALCKRYDIENTNRVLHGALLDAEILASVYLAMTGGQVSLFQENEPQGAAGPRKESTKDLNLANKSPVIYASQEEQRLHQSFLEILKEKSGVNLWEDS